MSEPTENEVLRVIGLMTMYADHDDNNPVLSLIYRMAHLALSPDCKHPKWVEEFRLVQTYFENLNKAPADPTKTEQPPWPLDYVKLP